MAMPKRRKIVPDSEAESKLKAAEEAGSLGAGGGAAAAPSHTPEDGASPTTKPSFQSHVPPPGEPAPPLASLEIDISGQIFCVTCRTIDKYPSSRIAVDKACDTVAI
jgi:hypothetical protein